MRRIITFAFFAFIPAVLIAQSVKVTYTVSDKEATYEPAGKVKFYPGDSITVKDISLFDLRRYSRGAHLRIESQRVEYFSGTFEISELYALAEQTKSKNLARAIGGKDFTPGASTRPAGDKSVNDSVISVVTSLQSFLDHPNLSFENSSFVVSQHDGIIDVYNASGKDIFVDVIWIKDGRCFSALSYAKDYVSYNPLLNKSSRTIRIDRFANAETLYIVGTSVPVAYNTISFSDYQTPHSKGTMTDFTMYIVRSN